MPLISCGDPDHDQDPGISSMIALVNPKYSGNIIINLRQMDDVNGRHLCKKEMILWLFFKCEYFVVASVAQLP